MKSNITKGHIIRLLPIVASLFAIFQFYFLPNYRDFTPLDRYAPTNVFGLVFGAIALIYLLQYIVGFFNQRIEKKLLQSAPIVTAVILLVALYDFFTLTTGILPQPFFPWPDAIFNAIIIDRSLLITATLHSMRLLFTGYFIGVILGIITGVSAGWFPRLRYWITPVLKLLGAVPAITWLPIIMLVANTLFGGSVFLIVLAVWHPVTNTTMNGVMNVPKGIFESASTFGVSKIGMIFKVAIPAALPSIFQGLIQGMSIACTALMIAELMGVEAGLGAYINWQRGWAQFSGMYGAILIIAFAFLLVNNILTKIQKRVLHWKEATS